MILNKNIFCLILILLLIFSRLIPHPPNFTPLIAVAVLSGLLFRNFYLSIFTLLCSMFVSDLIIGFHKNMFFIYVYIIFIGSIFFKLADKINYKNLLIFSFGGAFLFYLLSNFTVWFSSDVYSKNLKGLLECYILAIPFFSNTITSTLIYSYVFFVLIKNFNIKNVTKKFLHN